MKRLIYIAIVCSFIISAGTASGQDNFAKWRAWISGQQDYLDKVESFIKRTSEIAIQRDTDLKYAINKKDKVLGDNVIAVAAGRLSAVVDELKALTPPKEFKEYHEKIIAACQFRQMANEATLKKNLFNIKDCGSKAIASEIDAMESIRRLYISHGAPSQIIDSIDRSIASYRQKLAL